MESTLFDVAEIEITYTRSRASSFNQKITSSKDAYEIFLSAIGNKIERQEVFYIMLLNNSNTILGINRISEGAINATLVDVRLVFQTALIGNATSLILAHNHPSGKLQASEADKKLTKKLTKASDYLDIKILDHLIVTSDSYLSFTDEGLL